MPINLQALEAAAANSPAVRQAAATGTTGAGADSALLSGAGNFFDALTHHAGNFFHHAAQGVENGVAGAANWIDQKTGQGQPSAWNKSIQDTVSADAAAGTRREADYQARVKGSTAANFGAVAGEIAPWLLPTNLPAAGLKVAEWAKPAIDALPFGQQAISTAVKRGTEGAIIGGGDSGGSLEGAGMGAAGAAVLPPVLGGGAKYLGKVLSYGGAIKNPSASAAQALSNLADKVSPRPDAITAAASAADPKAIAKILSQPVDSITAMSTADRVQALTAATQAMSPQQKLAAALELGQSPVPGVKYSADQALAPFLKNDNVPLVQLTQGIRNTAGGAAAFAERDAQNNAARLAHLQQFTKTPEEMQALVTARRQAARDAMGYVDNNGVQVPGQFTNPVDPTPVLDQITRLKQSSFGTDPVIARSLASMEQQIGQAADHTEQGGVLVRPDLLDGIRQNLRGIISDNASNGVVSSKQTAGLQPLASAISDSIEASNPGYRNYLADYAQRSIPINTGEAANGLLSSATGVLNKGAGNAAGDTQLTLPAITSALNSVGKLEHGVSPEFQSALGNVHQDLQNVSVSNAKFGGPGSPTEYYGNLSGQIADAIDGKIGLFSHPITQGLAGAAGLADGILTGGIGSGLTSGVAGLVGLNQGSKIGASRLASGYVDMLLNPGKLADALSQYNSPDMSSLGSYIKTLPIVGAAP